MKKIYLKAIIIIFALLIQSAFSQTNISGGDVSGTWTKAISPYFINGEITIPNDSTLIIEPGVEVIFKGHYKFNVQGRLLAIGTKQDTIHFTAENTGTGWHGIRFTDTPNTNDTSKFFYCSFKYGKANTGINFDRCGGAMMIKQFDKVLISSCLFDSNMNSGTAVPQAGPAIYVYNASVTIENSTFSNNSGSLGTAIACIGNSKAIISHNVLFKNSGLGASIAAYGSGSSPLISGNIVFNNFGYYGAGINSEVSSNPRIENNIIFNNRGTYGSGIFCWSNVKPIIINNTIVNNNGSSNGGGIFCTDASHPMLINNIIYGNTRSKFEKMQVYISDKESDPNFLYCNIEGGKDGFEGAGAGNNYGGLYKNNIDADPLLSDDYQLSDFSPCIGAGIDSVEVEGIWYKVSSFCFYGNPRPNPAGSMPDIGACESPLGTPVTGIEEALVNPIEFFLYQNYPNPFNPSTKISWQSPVSSLPDGKAGWQTLKVYDVLGSEIATLVDEYKSAGTYEVEFNASNLVSGVYYYQLEAGNFLDTKKMLLLR